VKRYPDALDRMHRRILAEQHTPAPADFHNDPLDLPSLYQPDHRVQTWDEWLAEHQQMTA
jgi:hypothetical protein